MPPRRRAPRRPDELHVRHRSVPRVGARGVLGHVRGARRTRKYNVAIIFKRAKGQGRITRIVGLGEFMHRYGEHVVEEKLLRPARRAATGSTRSSHDGFSSCVTPTGASRTSSRTSPRTRSRCTRNSLLGLRRLEAERHLLRVPSCSSSIFEAISMKSSSVTMPTRRSSWSTGRQPTRSRRIRRSASIVCGLGRHRRDLALHDVADRRPARRAAAHDEAQHGAVGDDADQLVIGILDGDVADALPDHEVRDHLDRVVGVDREQVRRHVLLDALVVAAGWSSPRRGARAPTRETGRPVSCRCTVAATRALARSDGVDAIAQRVPRRQLPARAGAAAADALLDDAEVLLDVGVVDALRGAGRPRRSAAGCSSTSSRAETSSPSSHVKLRRRCPRARRCRSSRRPDRSRCGA